MSAIPRSVRMRFSIGFRFLRSVVGPSEGVRIG